MMHIKEPLLLIRKSNLCGGSGFPLSLSEWSSTICLTPYNRKKNVLSASLNFLPSTSPAVGRLQQKSNVKLTSVLELQKEIVDNVHRGKFVIILYPITHDRSTLELHVTRKGRATDT